MYLSLNLHAHFQAYISKHLKVILYKHDTYR